MAALDETGQVSGADTAAPLPPRTTDTAPEGPKYGSLPEWVDGHLARLIRRRLGGQLTWCPQWWRHPEAVSRLNAMWDEWEKARVEGTMSQWWIYHCDPHLAVLMSRDNGPFMACRADGEASRHTRLDPLPCAASDPRLWGGAAFSGPVPRRSNGRENGPGGA